MCEQETAVRAATGAGTLTESEALALHVEQCESCAAAALDAAMHRVGLGTGEAAPADTDELRLAMAAVGLETPAERRRLEFNAGKDPLDDALRRRFDAPPPPLETVKMSNPKDPTDGAEKNEQSALINLDSLERKPGGFGGSGRPQDADSSGLIDLSSLGLDGPSTRAGADGMRVAGPAPTPVRVVSNAARRRGMLSPATIAAGFFGVAVIGGAAYFALKSTPAEGPAPAALASAPPSAAVASAAPSVAPASVAAVASAAAPVSEAAPASQAVAAANAGNAKGGRPAPAAGGRPAVAAAGAPAAPTPASAPPAPVSVAAAAPAKKAPDTGEVDDLLGNLDGKGPAKPAGGNSTAPGGDVDPLLPAQLSKPQILTVVKKASGAVSTCKERQPDATGTVMVAIKIERTGAVTGANAKAPFAGTPIGSCIESTVRTLRFPAFSGDPMTINMPFSL
jgi:hypothetical protein